MELLKQVYILHSNRIVKGTVVGITNTEKAEKSWYCNGDEHKFDYVKKKQTVIDIDIDDQVVSVDAKYVFGSLDDLKKYVLNF